jgi:D-alanine-D-alanine ligase-like ATP-grasp enzyme
MEIVFDKLFRPLVPLQNVFELFLAWLQPERVIPPIVTTLSYLGITKKVWEFQDSDSSRTQVLYEAAKPRNIKLYHVFIFNFPTTIFVAEKDGRTMVYTHEPRPAGPPSPSLYWMDNKEIMLERFRAAGIPVPKGRAVKSEKEAIKAFEEIKGKVIVKPILGSRSRHTFIHIDTVQELVHAFHIAQQISPWVIVEQQLEGMVYRATVIGGKVVGVLRREPPHVIGDGTYTVKELIEQENKNPLRHGSIFHTLVVGPEAHTELKRQQLTLDSIPSAGQMVSLNQKVSRGEGASNSDVTDETHPDNIQLFEKIGQVLEDPLVGIDFIIPDMTNSWQEQDCGVIECNAMPFIDLHHYPLTGKPRDAAGALWDLVFPDKKTP